MLAFTGLLLPGLLLLHTGRLPAAPAAAHTTQVVRKVVVRKVVHERTVVVREVAPAPAGPVPAQPARRRARGEGPGEEAGAGRRSPPSRRRPRPRRDHDAHPRRLGRASESGRAAAAPAADRAAQADVTAAGSSRPRGVGGDSRPGTEGKAVGAREVRGWAR